jgi:hypothetical protein
VSFYALNQPCVFEPSHEQIEGNAALGRALLRELFTNVSACLLTVKQDRQH